MVQGISSFFVRTKNEAKKSPLDSCVFPSKSEKAGAESKHSALPLLLPTPSAQL
jgi:hypothetical protein